MTTLQTTGVLLASDPENRRLKYRLLTYGEEGNTSAGRLTASAGSIQVPEDLAELVVNEEHDPRRPVGRLVSLTDSDVALDCEVDVARTRAGDDALELAASGLRKGISVELADIVVRAGQLLRGRLTGAGLTVRPAYPSSVLTASDVGELDDEDQTPTDPAPSEGDPTVDPKQNEGQALTASALAQILDGIKNMKNENPPEPPAGELTASEMSVGQLAELVASARNGGSRELVASALDTIAQPNVYDVLAQPAYLGELWRGRAYQQRFSPLLNRRPLTSATRVGWRFKDGMTPKVDVWDPAFIPTGEPGDANHTAAASTVLNTRAGAAYEMTDIPSNPVAAESVTFGVGRIAGGWRTDRVHKDLPTPGYWESFWREATEDYARKEDGLALAAIQKAASSVTATGSDAADAWSKLILGAAVVLDYCAPEWAIVGNDLWRELARTTEQERLAFLNSSLGLDNTDGQLASFTIVGAPYSRKDLDGTIVVGARNAVDLYTLGGAGQPPIRVSAEVVEKGAVDDAIFGYYSLDTVAPKALVKVV